MIPIIELHDGTMSDAADAGWSVLPDLVTFWTRDKNPTDVVSVIKKHEQYLLINIGNELGSDQLTDKEFKDGYNAAYPPSAPKTLNFRW